MLVDTRPEWQRRAEGEIPGALLIERNQLEWRLDPTSDARIPEAADHDVEVIVVCSEGYSSSLAAASLQDLGLHRATDLVGGFQAWRAAGLPVTRTRLTVSRTASGHERRRRRGERAAAVEEVHRAGEVRAQRRRPPRPGAPPARPAVAGRGSRPRPRARAAGSPPAATATTAMRG